MGRNRQLHRFSDITNVAGLIAPGGGHGMPLKARGRPRERTQGRRIGPVVDAELLCEFDAIAAKEGLSRNKALEEAMRSFLNCRRQRRLTRTSEQI